MSGMLDGQGCLTDAGLTELAGARPGEAPAELAQHVASCARCQERWLKLAAGSSGPRATPESAARRRWGTLGVVVGMLLFALLALVGTLRYLAG